MFKSAKVAPPAAKTLQAKVVEAHPLDGLTGGAFSAPTSGERAARIREWLLTQPSAEQMAEVYKDLANRDKGAAKPLKEKLDDLKRAKGQEAAAAEWADKAQVLLALGKLNLADALAWQRDAAKAGAPLSREPLAGLKVQLADRVKTIEDLQHRTQVQREAAVLIAQRTEVLSTKPWRDAQATWDALRADVAHWQAQADELAQDSNWASVDPRFPPLLDASRAQLLAVWEAFQGALSLAVAAAADGAAPLPAVPVWADELRSARSLASHAAMPAGDRPARPPKARLDPAVLNEMRVQAASVVQHSLSKLEQEVAEGHGKATPKAAADLRNALKEHVRHIDSKLEAAAHAALTAAGELEGWQRWRADQIREELVVKAEALVAKPLGGRKQQEALRGMREQWKTSDQGGTPNHALWKRFDDACNEAHKVVEVWLEKAKEQVDVIKAQRRVLVDEVLAWTAANVGNTDWKHQIRSLNGFVEQWTAAGHLNEKAFAEIQPVWKAAMDAADAALKAARAESLAHRKAMIDEAQVLGAEPQLHIDAVKALQQRWQHEAQSVPIERKQEQKLWDAFRKPIDDAFQRKTLEREKAASALGEHDRMVLELSKVLDAANATGDAQKIHAAMANLEAGLRGRYVPPAPVTPAAEAAPAAPAAENRHAASSSESNSAPALSDTAQAAPETVASQDSHDPQPETAASQEPELTEDRATAESQAENKNAELPAAPAAIAAPAKPAKPVIAMRGDDRPGMKKNEPMAAGRGGKFGDRKDARPGGKPDGRGARPADNKFEPYRAEREERSRFNDRPAYEERGPRLGDAAFRAQRDAFDHAQLALKKLASQAHGEVLVHLLTAWEKRDPELVPNAQVLGKQVTPAVRSSWVQAVKAASGKDASEALLRLEMAAELPTPAEHISARRLLQLQLLTRRNAPAPAETWGDDAAQVLAGNFDAGNARRVQNALKVLLKR